MFSIIEKDSTQELSPNLKHTEIMCRCQNPRCSFTIVDLRLPFAFERVREIWGGPIFVTSGFRCQDHNEKVGGSPRSKHAKGQALDLRPMKGKLDDFEKVCRLVFPFTIKYEKENFVHCDLVPRRKK